MRNIFCKDYPLGLPQGSVRAILALSVIIFTFWYFFETKQIPKELVTIDTFVITYYFTKRENYQNKLKHYKLRYKLNDQAKLRETIIRGESISECIDKLHETYKNNDAAVNIMVDEYTRLE